MAVRPLLSDPPILLPVRAAAGGALWVLARPASTDCQDRIPRTRLRPEHQFPLCEGPGRIPGRTRRLRRCKATTGEGHEDQFLRPSRAAVICFESGRSAAGE